MPVLAGAGYRIRRQVKTGLTHLAAWGTIFILALPVLYALVMSTLSFQEAYRFPPSLVPGRHLLANLQEAWVHINMGRLLFNSTVVAVAVAVGKMVLSVLAAFAFTYFGDFRGKWLFFGLILITHMLPLPVRIVPTFELITRLGWADTYWALTVPFFASATGTLLFRQFFLTVPHALADAARIDGAGPMRFLVSILLPLSRTNLAALFMVEFIYAWNEYLWPLVATSSDRMRVVQIGIKTLLASEAQAAEWNVVMAGAMISIVPPLLVLLLLQGAFVKGFALQQEK
ncbi:MAG: ABC transporter permease subunit [Firmicutes bacterium]|nr:ABC transporter permease [Bacillota bacterium]NMA70437.1 ABC transporter permease subunit [Bacillota bacterium]